MPERLQDLPTEIYSFFLKIIFPAIVGVGIKIAVEMQIDSKKISWVNVVLSFVIGVGMAYLFNGVILKHFDEDYVPLAIGLVAIIGKEFAVYLIYKLNIDTFLTALINAGQDFILSVFKKKQ